MAGRQERVEPLDRGYDLSSLSGEVEAVARGDRSMQQCLARRVLMPAVSLHALGHSQCNSADALPCAVRFITQVAGGCSAFVEVAHG